MNPCRQCCKGCPFLGRAKDQDGSRVDWCDRLHQRLYRQWDDKGERQFTLRHPDCPMPKDQPS